MQSIPPFNFLILSQIVFSSLNPYSGYSIIPSCTKSLKFLSIGGLYKALIDEQRNSNYPQFSDHYFTGEYPIKPSDNLEGLKIKQLSLLSGKSTN